MTFPASSASLSKTWQEMQLLALTVQRQANAAITDLAGDVTAQYVLNIYQSLMNARLKLQAYAATPGLVQYVKDQLDDQNINIITEYNAMIAAVDVAKDWVSANFPVDAGGYVLEKKFNSTGFEQRTFNSTQTAGLTSALQSLVAAIG